MDDIKVTIHEEIKTGKPFCDGNAPAFTGCTEQGYARGLSKRDTIVWKDIDIYEGLYQISNRGEVRSLNKVIAYRDGRTEFRRGIDMKLVYHKNGYVYVGLTINKKQRRINQSTKQITGIWKQ